MVLTADTLLLRGQPRSLEVSGLRRGAPPDRCRYVFAVDGDGGPQSGDTGRTVARAFGRGGASLQSHEPYNIDRRKVLGFLGGTALTGLLASLNPPPAFAVPAA